MDRTADILTHAVLKWADGDWKNKTRDDVQMYLVKNHLRTMNQHHEYVLQMLIDGSASDEEIGGFTFAKYVDRAVTLILSAIGFMLIEDVEHIKDEMSDQEGPFSKSDNFFEILHALDKASKAIGSPMTQVFLNKVEKQ